MMTRRLTLLLVGLIAANSVLFTAYARQDCVWGDCECHVWYCGDLGPQLQRYTSDDYCGGGNSCRVVECTNWESGCSDGYNIQCMNWNNCESAIE